MDGFQGIILDIDGTLVDSNLAHAESWQRALAEAGLRFHLEQVRKLIGMGGDKLLPTLTGISESSEQGKTLSQRHSEIYKEEYLPRLKPFPQALDLLRKMKSEGYKLAVATSSKRDELEAVLKVTGLAELLQNPRETEAQVTQAEVKESKPEPDLVERAIEELGLPPEQAVMLGDTPYDAHAAKRARVKFVGLRSGGWDERGLQGAIAIFKDAADLLRNWDRSPLARKQAKQAA